MNGSGGVSAAAASTRRKLSATSLSCSQSADQQQPPPKLEEKPAARLLIYWLHLFMSAAGPHHHHHPSSSHPSSFAFDTLLTPSLQRPSGGFTLHLPSTSRPSRPEPLAQITPQINNVPNLFGIISGSFHLLALPSVATGEERRPQLQGPTSNHVCNYLS